MKDRRRYQRYRKNIPVIIECDGKTQTGQLVDLSMIGAGCYVPKRIALYTELTISFVPDDPFAFDDERFSCEATVVRCCKNPQDKDYQLGLFFTHLSEELLTRIMDLAYY
jgi:c-di-GMP-binding flagellar brake protein YcgR